MNSKKFLFVLLLLPLGVTAQKKIAVIDIKNVAHAYVDRPGDLYILHTDNTVSKFDTLGMPVAAPQFEATPTVFEPRDGARMFTYSADNQQIAFFSAGVRQTFTIQNHYAIDPIRATSAGDNGIWVVDRADWSLKRISLKTQQVLAEALLDRTQFKGEPVIMALREYQNFLFILEKNTGILIFNSLGMQIKKIPGSPIGYFNFLGRELYYEKEGTLIFYDLFDGSTREQPADKEALYTLFTDARKYVVYAEKVEVWEN